jgi:HEAT repeat protein
MVFPCVVTAQPASPVDALIARGAVGEAVTAFDTAADRSKEFDTAQLERLAKAVLTDVAASGDDPTARTEACVSLFSGQLKPPCAAGLALAADTEGGSTVIRLRALAAGLQAGSPQAERQLNAAVAAFGPREWSAVVDAAPSFPPAIATGLLSQALDNGAPDVRYGALVKLAAVDDPSAVPVLKRWSRRTQSPGHLIALAGVAASGDAEALASIKELLPQLNGRELLAAGIALGQRGDPRGIETLRVVLSGPDDLQQLEAAAALAKLGEASGRARLESELNSSNVWMRLRSLELLRGLGVPPAPTVWRQMNDPMAWIRVRAAQVTLEGSRRGAARAPTR